jgi:hypothetical protein
MLFQIKFKKHFRYINYSLNKSFGYDLFDLICSRIRFVQYFIKLSEGNLLKTFLAKDYFRKRKPSNELIIEFINK